MSGSELFDNYEQEFNSIYASISHKLNIILPSQSGEKKKEIIRGLEREFRECDELLGQMEVELHSLAAHSRSKLSPRLRSYKSEIEAQRKEFVRNG
jgi:vesicle transport through interaction with t-SNAREs protein 1